jgi:hypothetical protein
VAVASCSNTISATWARRRAFLPTEREREKEGEGEREREREGEGGREEDKERKVT